jgi:hypothetical protein
MKASDILSEDIVKFHLENLTALTFEVTDKCNLYCGRCEKRGGVIN